jgi:peptide/nickel transport system permease protein
MLLTMFAVSIILFLLLEINIESIAVKVLGPYSLEAQRLIWLENNGYNEPLVVRYFVWLGNFLTGDFGTSTIYKIPVSEILWPRLWNTTILAFWVFVFLIPVSLVLGILSA